MVDGVVKSADALQPSLLSDGSGDLSDVFPKYPMNIITGKNGKAGYVTNGTQSDVNDTRDPKGAINIFDTAGNRQITISGNATDKILRGDRGKLGKTYEKQKQK